VCGLVAVSVPEPSAAAGSPAPSACTAISQLVSPEAEAVQLISADVAVELSSVNPDTSRHAGGAGTII